MNKRTVLVVDDHHDTRELLVLSMTRAGFNVAEAATGHEAVAEAKAHHPDLILLDLSLPGVSGDQVIELLKTDAATREIPVIVNSAHPIDSSLVQRAMASGAAEVLQKPVTFSKLRQTVWRYLPPANGETAMG